MKKLNLLSIVFVALFSVYSIDAQNKVNITSIKPTTGSLAGNTKVTLKGSGFSQSKSVGVFFKNDQFPNGQGVSNFKVKSDSVITFTTVPQSKPNTSKVYLELKAAAKKVYANTTFQFKSPNISSIHPDSSTVKGNDTISIYGDFLKGASYVKFGIAGATPFYTSETAIKVVNPAHKTGKVSVQVQVNGVYSSKNDAPQFKYSSNLPDSNYTLYLRNQSGLGDQYKVYVLGYSTASQKMLTLDKTDSTASFTPMPTTPDSGFVESFELGNEVTKIELNNKNPIVGARIYFFVANTNKGYQDNSNLTANKHLGFKYKSNGTEVFQVKNPPQNDYPQYSYIEATFKRNQGLYIDVSTVDGFFFPVSIIAENKNGKELDRIGQSDNISAKQVVKAYSTFVDNHVPGKTLQKAYNELVNNDNTDLTALLNPGLYLDGNTSNLETVFDSALDSLFTDSTLNMNIWQNGINGFQAYYHVKPVANLNFPGTSNSHTALEFTAAGEDTLHLFNPVGFSIVSYKDHKSDKSLPIEGHINNDTLFFSTALPLDVEITKGMYVSSGGGSTDGKTRIEKIIKTEAGITAVTLSSSDNYSNIFQYKFAKAPANYYLSSGQMTFAGIGLFADGSYRYSDKNLQVVVNGLENQISTALNRGVALISSVNANKKGHTTETWAKETAWYPPYQAQNYFSYFMHTAQVNHLNIFSLPKNSVKSASGDPMAKAYGFAYDENPNPLGGNNGPQVPSEFLGSYPKGTKQLVLILGPWE